MRLLSTLTDNVLEIVRGRSAERSTDVERVVREIISDVHTRGDEALIENARRFDAPSMNSIVVSPTEIEAAAVTPEEEEAIEIAIARVRRFHAEQHEHFLWVNQWRIPAHEDRGWGGHVGQRILPLSHAGIYVPGGQAAYPSSVIMNAVPALVAGVEDVIVTSPARRDGTLLPAVLVAMRLVGISQAFRIGGAAAIAALALGTESVPKVDKVAGPGNQFVNEAKRQLWGQVGLDGYAGPSEVCVIADDEANAAFAAADLLTQVEHAPDNVAFLITLSEAKRAEILVAIEYQLANAPRAAIMRRALEDHGTAIVCRDLDEACDVANAIAPEHLTLAVADPEEALPLIQNAGCVLLGEFSPESAGDYVAGPSHTLPTGGAARWQSPVNVMDFIKFQSVIHLSAEDLDPLIPVIETMGQIEGFPAHGFGGTVRR